ncbi:MAG: DUF2232 domain-containing protein [Bacteroidetes bacterium]|nr:DUF2232 domain-containing protein [Bacteroidota bacterium]
MTNQVGNKPEAVKMFQLVLLLAALLVLPGLQFALFGWMNGLLPLVIFIYLYKYGSQKGNKIILQSMVVAVIGCIILQSVETVLIAVTMIPCGYVVSHSARIGLSPTRSGLKAGFTLIFCWVLLWILLSASGDVPTYANFVQSLHEGVNEALQHYRDSDTITSENLMVLEQTLFQMKVYVPKLLPSIILGSAVFIVWFTLAFGNRLLALISGKQPWESYRYWQLPEKLIWLFIASAVFTLWPADPNRIVGINLLIVTSIVYCFQGIAILVYFLNKWKLPKLFRLIIYVMIVFQSFGTVFLIGVGVADVWLDFRRLTKDKDLHVDNDNKHEDTTF